VGPAFAYARSPLVHATPINASEEPDVHLNYISAEHVHLCAVTAPAGEDERFVVTADFTKDIKPGMSHGKAEGPLRSRGA
jgi:hypothetical protein